MRARTRLAVHSPLANPNASGPRLSARSRSRTWAGPSLGGRPVRWAWRSPRTPDCSSSCAQRLTDCRWTPTARATWDWLSPCRSNRAASIRRRSRAAKSRRTPAGLPMPYTLTESRALVTILCKSQIDETGVPADRHVPLIWMNHVRAMRISFPNGTRKPQYIKRSASERSLLLPNRNYVLLRRFSAKEEARRLVAAPWLKQALGGPLVGIENHLN